MVRKCLEKFVIEDLGFKLAMTRYLGIILILLLPASAAVHGQTWKPLGPTGGDVRSLATDPSRPARLFLGTVDGHIFGSLDAGEHWKLLGRAGVRQDNVITAIIVDPRNSNVLFTSAWTQDPAAGGGVFRSSDGGI